MPEDGTSPFAFTYIDLARWYERLSQQRLRPALVTFTRLLDEKLDLELNDFDRKRIRVAGGRVKDPYRLWTKMGLSKNVARISTLDSTTDAIDDLIGVRIVCNNLCDIARLQQILGSLPLSGEAEGAPLTVEEDSERPYHLNPKPSGYRAYHVNLGTLVPGIDGMHRLRAEVQVRTRLQDGWGELTHEDTYKPGTSLPPLAVTLARRMADLLATVDDMAEDLRQELDRAVEATVADVREDEASESRPRTSLTDPHPSPVVPAEDLLAEVRDLVGALTRPAPLAALAHELLRRFGPGIAASWGSYGSFKPLLMAAVPDIHIVDEGPGYVIPEGSDGQAISQDIGGRRPDHGIGVPRILRDLKMVDRNAPLVSSDQMRHLMNAVECALSDDLWENLELSVGVARPAVRELNLLTKHVRDNLASKDVRVARPHLDYMLKSLLFSNNLRPGLSADEIVIILSHWMFSRAVSLGLSVDVGDRDELKQWLDAAAHDPHAES